LVLNFLKKGIVRFKRFKFPKKPIILWKNVLSIEKERNGDRLPGGFQEILFPDELIVVK
jgi:hypothetical protein